MDRLRQEHEQDQKELALFRTKFEELQTKINQSDHEFADTKKINGTVGDVSKSLCPPLDEPIDIARGFSNKFSQSRFIPLKPITSIHVGKWKRSQFSTST